MAWSNREKEAWRCRIGVIQRRSAVRLSAKAIHPPSIVLTAEIASPGPKPKSAPAIAAIMDAGRIPQAATSVCPKAKAHQFPAMKIWRWADHS